MTMERALEQLGFLSVLDAFTILRAGVPIYIASAPERSNTLPLRGGWKDEVGTVHYDRACVYLSEQKAMRVARAFGQQCILALAPNPNAKGRVYLLQDSVRNRVYALYRAGGFTADGDYLLVAVADGELPFEPVGEAHSLPADIFFPSTDTHTHTYARAGGHCRACPCRACSCQIRSFQACFCLVAGEGVAKRGQDVV